MNTAFIGDIHGCVDQLLEVLDQVQDDVDRIVFLGDYVNRGPDPKSVLDVLVEFQATSGRPVTFLRGNHDAAFSEALVSDEGVGGFLKMGGATTIRSYLEPPYEDVVARLRQTVPDTHRAFLSALEEQYVADGVVAVHDARAISTTGNFIVAGHASQSSLKPLVTQQMAIIDTGCGTGVGGRLTCFYWPSQFWIQSSSAWS